MNKEVKHTHTRLISKVLMKKTPLFEMAQEPPPSVTVLISNKNDRTRYILNLNSVVFLLPNVYCVSFYTTKRVSEGQEQKLHFLMVK